MQFQQISNSIFLGKSCSWEFKILETSFDLSLPYRNLCIMMAHMHSENFRCSKFLYQAIWLRKVFCDESVTPPIVSFLNSYKWGTVFCLSLQGQSPKYKKNAHFIAAGKKWTRNVFDEKRNGTLCLLDLKATIFMNVVSCLVIFPNCLVMK